MCATCGCSEVDHAASPADHAHPHPHDHGHAHGGAASIHEHGEDPTAQITTLHPSSPHVERMRRIEHDVLAKNCAIAEANRAWLDARQIVAFNLVSGPGAGKTTLLERTIAALRGEEPVAVIEGDQATAHDAERIRAAGAPVVQVNTGTGCHLDAEMIQRALQRLDPPPRSTVLIENVGNLVCPALFDLGEHARVLLCAVTDGTDKPEKYPHIFRSSALLVINKLDLLPHVPFDLEACIAGARLVNPTVEILALSAWRGDELTRWYDWVRQRRAARR